MKRVIIFLGIPGSGKGTQAARLAEAHGYIHISMGDILRGLKDRTDLDEELKEALDTMLQGKLVKDDVVYRLGFDAIRAALSMGKGVVLDGVIRTQAQAMRYHEFFEELGIEHDVQVIEIELDDADSFDRLASRIASGSQVRPDDTREILTQRIKVQGNDALKPLKAFYQSKTLLAVVDGRQSMDDVAHDIEQVLEHAS